MKIFPLFLITSTLLSGFSQSLDCIIPRPSEIIPGEKTTKTLKITEEKRTPSLAQEAYELEITPTGVALSYATPEGKQRALASIQQLQSQLDAHPKGLPTGIIKDAPAYPWRGMMIDVARHYYPLEDLKRFVDAAHLYKFNKLHIHLTDDQGWISKA